MVAPKTTRKKQPKAYHHGDLRAALITAARRILETDGLQALSLRGVARAAGVSQAAPYHHFASKDALLDAIAAEGFNDLTEAMESRMKRHEGAAARLNASGVGYVAFAVANPALFALMFGGLHKGAVRTPEVAETGGRAYGVLQNAIAAAFGQKPTSPYEAPLAALGAWSLVHGLAKLLIDTKLDPAVYGAADSETLAEIVVERFGPSHETKKRG